MAADSCRQSALLSRAVNLRRFAYRRLCEWKFKSRGAVHSCPVQSSTGASVSPGGGITLSV